MGDTLHVWNLRVQNADLTLLRPKLEEQLARYQFRGRVHAYQLMAL